MKKYEYAISTCTEKSEESVLKTFGNDGWECWFIHPYQERIDGGDLIFFSKLYFK